jgi:hypothetical protein
MSAATAPLQARSVTQGTARDSWRRGTSVLAHHAPPAKLTERHTFSAGGMLARPCERAKTSALRWLLRAPRLAQVPA